MNYDEQEDVTEFYNNEEDAEEYYTLEDVKYLLGC